MLEGLSRFEQFRIMVASDHLTPISKRTHTDDPTLFAWASELDLAERMEGAFSEKGARSSGIYFENGHDVMPMFLSI